MAVVHCQYAAVLWQPPFMAYLCMHEVAGIASRRWWEHSQPRQAYLAADNSLDYEGARDAVCCFAGSISCRGQLRNTGSSSRACVRACVRDLSFRVMCTWSLHVG